MTKSITPVLLALLLLTSAQALAYIGPGAGISVVGSVLSILATFFVAIGAILVWPVRKFLKRRKARREALDEALPAENRSTVQGEDVPGDERQA